MVLKFSYYREGKEIECEYSTPERLEAKDSAYRMRYLLRMMQKHIYDQWDMEKKDWIGAHIYDNEICIARVTYEGRIITNKVTDIHCHIVPNFDDGSTSIKMSMDMIDMLYEQNVRDVFCTSHSWDDNEFKQIYQQNFNELKDIAKSKYPDLTLHPGSEILCDKAEIDYVIESLKNGTLLPLGETKYVLTEFFFDVRPREIIYIVHKLILNGWTPIISHIERYSNVFRDETIECLIDMGALNQVNAYSFCEETDHSRKERARKLLQKRQIHFIGSDAHQIEYRAPNIGSGIEYIRNNCTLEYADQVCYLNANVLLKKENVVNDK